MKKALIVVVAAVALTACNNSTNPVINDQPTTGHAVSTPDHTGHPNIFVIPKKNK